MQASNTCLPAFRALAEEGTGYVDRFAVFGCDEPYKDAAKWTQCKANADKVRQEWAGVRTPATGSLHNAQTNGAVNLAGARESADRFDVLVPTVNEMDGKAIQDEYPKGKVGEVPAGLLAELVLSWCERAHRLERKAPQAGDSAS